MPSRERKKGEMEERMDKRRETSKKRERQPVRFEMGSRESKKREREGEREKEGGFGEG